MTGLFVRKTFFNFLHELQDGAYAEKVEKINMKITPTYIDGKLNKKADIYYIPENDEGMGNILFLMTLVFKSLRKSKTISNNAKSKHIIIVPFIDINRRKLFDVLMKLISDMLFFQLSKPTINDIWWNLNEIYSNLVTFIKNIADGNFLEFKLFMGTYIFSSKLDVSFNKEGLSISEYFTSQMLYVLNWSLICENQENKIVSTDQHERILANLKPILSILTEITTGPCKLNQQIIQSVKYIPLYGNFLY